MTARELLSKLAAVKQTGTDSWMARCPAHDDKNPSLSITQAEDKVLLKCFAGCSQEAVIAAMGISKADLFATQPKPVRRVEKAVYDYTGPDGKLLFQVVRFEPKDFRQRRPDGQGGWVWNLDGIERVLFHLPKLKGIQDVIVCEGEKDVLTLEAQGFTATCNPMGASKSKDKSKWLDSYSESLRGKDVYVIADKDDPGRNHAQQVAKSLFGKAQSVRVAELPDVNGWAVKDSTDYFQAGGTKLGFLEVLQTVQPWEPGAQHAESACSEPELVTVNSSTADDPAESVRKPLTLRSPGEILAMQFTDDDIILGDRLLAKGQPLVIAGAGGLGKSRLLTQLAACCVTGRKFLCFDTGCPELKWLILQTENSNRRFQGDLASLQKWLGDDWEKFNSQVVIHTLEHDDDAIVSLDSRENQIGVTEAILRSGAGVVAVDPLNEFSAGDLNKDDGMRATLQALGRVCRKNNPERGIVVAHHALTGKAGASRATGYDRSSFARNSKVLFAWTRGQINLAPANPDNNDQLVVACGKCSNGREFQPFGITLNHETMIYECDPSISVEDWERDMTGKADEPLMNPQRVAELCKPLTAKADLAKAIIADCGCSRATAYRHIARATRKTITHNKANDTYSKK